MQDLFHIFIQIAEISSVEQQSPPLISIKNENENELQINNNKENPNKSPLDFPISILQQFDIKSLSDHLLFALQLYHRWCLRAVTFSKYPKRPQSKPIQMNV
jgi:hypothetical protein